MQFLTSGRFIKEHQAGGGTGRMKQAMQRAVPVATERFQDALDELENEVRMAQTVLRRDLALLKQDRKKREAAAKQHEVERARLAAASSLSVPATNEEVAVKPESTTPAAQHELSPPTEQPAKVDTPEADLKREEEPEHPRPVEANTASSADPIPDNAHTNGNPQDQDFDFDFEFGDHMDTAGDNADTADMMDTSGDMDFNLDEGPSLLRGLEDFAKDGDDNNAGAETNMDMDFPMPDLPDMNTDTKPPGEQKNPTEPPRQPATQTDNAKDNKPVQEASETKATKEVKDTTNNDEPLETMVTDNLEDLFNLDDYETAEGGSAFDDAFFSFD